MSSAPSPYRKASNEAANTVRIKKNENAASSSIEVFEFKGH